MPINKRAPLEQIDRGATFDADDDSYRYLLWRRWSEHVFARPLLVFIMLNPSTADALNNDPTVAGCERRARAWGYGGLYVANAFAYRATQPEDMKAQDDPIGKDNDFYIAAAMQMAVVSKGKVIVAWGNDGDYLNRSKRIVEIAKSKDIQLYCLKYCKNGQPGHPLYIPDDVKLKPWPKRWNLKRPS